MNPSHRMHRRDFVEWLRFLSVENQILRERPKLLFQQAANQPDSSSPASCARAQLREGKPRSWLRWINKPQSASPCLGTYKSRLTWFSNQSCSFASAGTRIVFPDADRGMILIDVHSGDAVLRVDAILFGVAEEAGSVAFAADDEVTIYHCDNGDLLARRSVANLTSYPGPPTACAIAGDGGAVVIGYSNGSLLLWIPALNTSTYLRHEGAPITSCAFSPDGALLAAGSQNGHVELWDMKDLRLRETLELHIEKVTRCEFAANGRILITTNGYASFWDLAEGRQIAARRAIAWTRDCRLLARGSQIEIVGDEASRNENGELDPPEVVARLSGHWGNVLCCDFSPDSSLVAWGGEDAAIRIANTGTGETVATLAGHAFDALHCVFSPDARLLMSGAGDGTVRLWDVELARTSISGSFHAREITDCAFSPMSDVCASASHDQTMKLWNVARGTLHTTFRGHVDRVEACAFSPDGRHLVSGGAHYDEVLRLWDAVTGESIAVIEATKGPVSRVWFSADGQRIASTALETPNVRRGSVYSVVQLWDVNTRSEIARFYDSDFFGFSKDGEMLVWVNKEAVLKICSAETGAELQVWREEGAQLNACAIAPDSTTLLIGREDGALTLHSRQDVNQILFRERGPGAVAACAYADSNAWIVAAWSDGTAKIWDRITGADIATRALGLRPDSSSALVISPDGRRVACLQTEVTVVDLITGERLELPEPVSHAPRWSPDALHLAVGTGSGVVYLLALEGLRLSSR